MLTCRWVVNIRSSFDRKQECASRGCLWIFLLLSSSEEHQDQQEQDTHLGVWHHSQGSEIIPCPSRGPDFFKHGSLLCCILWQQDTTATRKPKKPPMKVLGAAGGTARGRLIYPAMCCFTTMSFRRLQLSHCSTCTRATFPWGYSRMKPPRSCHSGWRVESQPGPACICKGGFDQ